MGLIKDDMKSFYVEVICPHADEMSTEDMWENFSNKLGDSINQHIPQKNMSKRWNLPWVNSKIREMIRKRHL